MKRKSFIIRLIIAIIFVSMIASTYFVRTQIEDTINSLFYPEVSSDVDSANLKAHFIEVGNADAIALELPDGKNMLIDSGDNKNESRNKLINYLDNTFFVGKTEKVFDYFLLTHSHADHVGGASKVFETYEIKKCFRPNQYTQAEAAALGNIDNENIETSAVFKNFIKSVENEGCEVEFFTANSDIVTSEFIIDFITPLSTKESNKNNYSPIIILTYAGKKIMFTGDAEKEVENAVLEKYDKANGEYSRSVLDIDILKVGHHGSTTSSSVAFLEAITPEYAVICTDGKAYGHPSETTLKNLSNCGTKNIYRTDLNGNVVIGIFSNGEIAVALGTYTKSFKVEWSYLAISIGSIGVVLIFTIKVKKPKRSKK